MSSWEMRINVAIIYLYSRRQFYLLRDETARLLGYKTHAAFVLDEQMAKTPEKVMGFLNNLWEKLTPGGEAERVVLMKLKKKEREGRGETFDEKYYLWDEWYYGRLHLEDSYQLDAQEVAKYFPLQSTIDRMLHIFEELLGLVCVQVMKRILKGLYGTEIPSSTRFGMTNLRTVFVGYLYLDLHPREGHVANFNMQPG